MDVKSIRTWAGQETASDVVQERTIAKSISDEGTGTRKHPFRVTDRDAFLKSIEGKNLAEKTHEAPVVSVPMDSIVATQKRVDSERLAGYLTGEVKRTKGQCARGSGALIDVPIAVKMGGTIFLRDGHHRMTAEWFRGSRVANVRLIDLDEESNNG